MTWGARSFCVAASCWLVLAGHAGAADNVSVVVHPSRTETLSIAELRAVYLKQKEFWGDGQPILAINQEAGSAARERFSRRLFGQGSRRLAGFWDQRYFEAGEFPPPTLASDEAVLRFVAGNPNAIGYVGVLPKDADVSVLTTFD